MKQQANEANRLMPAAAVQPCWWYLKWLNKQADVPDTAVECRWQYLFYITAENSGDVRFPAQPPAQMWCHALVKRFQPHGDTCTAHHSMARTLGFGFWHVTGLFVSERANGYAGGRPFSVN